MCWDLFDEGVEFNWLGWFVRPLTKLIGKRHGSGEDFGMMALPLAYVRGKINMQDNAGVLSMATNCC